MGDVQWKRRKMVSTCWIVLVSVILCHHFERAKWKNVWYSRLIFQNGSVAFCILSFKGLFQAKFNLSEMQVYYTSLPWKCVITAGHTNIDALKANFEDCSPGESRGPNPVGYLRGNALHKNFMTFMLSLTASRWQSVRRGEGKRWNKCNSVILI